MLCLCVSRVRCLQTRSRVSGSFLRPVQRVGRLAVCCHGADVLFLALRARGIHNVMNIAFHARPRLVRRTKQACCRGHAAGAQGAWSCCCCGGLYSLRASRVKQRTWLRPLERITRQQGCRGLGGAWKGWHTQALHIPVYMCPRLLEVCVLVACHMCVLNP